MAGLYIHIPFCASRCIYCGFYSTTSLEARSRYVEALKAEMVLRRQYLQQAAKDGGAQDSTIRTIYIGGGTPSQLTIEQIHGLFEAIGSCYGNHSIETTFEANPDDITPQLAKALKEAGVNRVSMGAQTFDDSRLRFLRRRHTSAEVATAMDTLRQAGIENVSIDLMFGFPGETIQQWEADIRHALQLHPSHVSAYSLMYEEHTPLMRMLEKGEVGEADDDTAAAMYKLMSDILRAEGFEHYEISNFALPGKRAIHNSNYWNGTPYIGIGAAAHSYNIESRQWNVSNINKYIEAISKGSVPAETEQLDDDTRYDDTVTTALRTKEGIDLSSLDARYKKLILKCAAPYIRSGKANLDGEWLRLTLDGWLVSDMIMSDLMIV